MRRRALIGIVAVGLVGCGGGDKAAEPPPGAPDADAKRVAQAYLDAYNARDARAICATLTRQVQRELATNKGTCVKTMQFSLDGSGEIAAQTVSEAYANGGEARATIEGSPRQITLERAAGSWRVSNGGL